MPSRTRRQSFLFGSLAAAGSLATMRGVAKGAEFTYKLAHTDPTDNAMHVAVAQMAASIRKESNGRLDIQIFPNSMLGSQISMLSQLRLNSVQFNWMNHSSYSTVVPVAQIAGTGFVFTSNAQALSAMDGALGAYIRKEFAAKGMYAFPQSGLTSFRQMTSSLKPIQSVDDMPGYKVRTLPAAIFVDLFKTLGASPVALSSDQMYTAAQTRLVDGVELPLGVIQSYRIFEVQKYVSITNHIWGGYTLAANQDAWNALPSDIQAIVQRNVTKYVLQERREFAQLDVSVEDKLKRQGLSFNVANVTGMRAKLAPYYAHWKNEFGSTAWSLLEDRVGKLT